MRKVRTGAVRGRAVMGGFCLLTLALLGGCDGQDAAPAVAHPVVEIALYEPIAQVLARSPLPFSKDCLKPVRMCWYEIERSSNDKNLPVVLIGGGEHGLRIEQVSDISTVIDEDLGDRVGNIDIKLRGLPDKSSYAEHQAFILQRIAELRSAGWKRYYLPSNPRVSGSQADKIPSGDNVLGHSMLNHPWLDPDYPIPLERWLHDKSFYSWYFHRDDAYLHVWSWCWDDQQAPMERATCLTTLQFQSEYDFWLSSFEENERPRWKELMPAKLAKDRETRRGVEEQLRAAGIEIDESYQDPPIKALAP